MDEIMEEKDDKRDNESLDESSNANLGQICPQESMEVTEFNSTKPSVEVELRQPIAASLDAVKEKLLKDLDDVSNIEHKTLSPKTSDITINSEKKDKINPNLLAAMNLERGNFFKGCKWAPDGLCLMTCSEDNIIRLMNTPAEVLGKKWGLNAGTSTMNPCLKIQEAEIIYDYDWWSGMNSMYPETCCFVTTAKDQPIHLWDAFNGSLRASYIAKNNVDEIASAHCVGFSPDGIQMICGFPKELRLFYIDRPGAYYETWPTRKRKRATGQRGIISTTKFSPDAATIACGSYDGTVGLYSSKNGDLIALFNSKSKGVTYIKFSTDGNRLYSGSRMGGSLICWDVRYMEAELFQLERKVTTNQRIYFDFRTKDHKQEPITEDLVVSGGTDGIVSFWDVKSAISGNSLDSGDDVISPVFTFSAHSDCVNGVNFHPFLPVLATGSGQRHFGSLSDDSEGDSDSDITEFEENSLKLWHLDGL